jgi:transposase InsO family protein
MTTEVKVQLASQARGDFGLPAVLAALGLPRSTWYYHQQDKVSYTDKHRDLREPLESIARKHPEYGYRRTKDELQELVERTVNHKVVQRLHRAWDLPLMRGTRSPKPSGIRHVIAIAGDRVNLVAGMGQIGPLQVLYTDFTELRYANGRRKAQLMPIIDHATKLVLGWAVGERAVTELALQAWTRATETLQAYGVSPERLVVHHDRDPVFTGYGWTSQLLLKDRVRISYALHGARDNPEMEGFNSRFKSENRSLLLDARSLAELQAVVAERMAYHNNERRHSAIGNKAPVIYIATLQPWP